MLKQRELYDVQRRVISELKEKYGLKHSIIVGDRGMLMQTEIEFAEKAGWNWISALTKRRMRTLLSDRNHPLNTSLFDRDLPCEVSDSNGRRYIVCKNDSRAWTDQQTRANLIAKTETKLQHIQQMVAKGQLKKRDKIMLRVGMWINRWKAAKYFKVRYDKDSNSFVFWRNEERIAKDEAMDGIYVLHTNVDASELSTTEVVSAYKNLSKVENAFRTLKTTLIEVRPIFHWTEGRIRSHVFICMLAYRIVHEMRTRLQTWLSRKNSAGQHRIYTFQRVLEELNHLKRSYIPVASSEICHYSNLNNNDAKEILTELSIKLPTPSARVKKQPVHESAI